MTSRLIILGVALAAIGCQSQPRVVYVDRPGRPTSPPQPAAAALAFTPPVAYAVADDLNLDRAGRGPGAYAGYESVVISETWVRQDDRQRWGRWGDQSQFERRAVSTTVTVQKR